MRKKPKDRQLDVPAEANRGKHVNFVAAERSEPDPSEDHKRGQPRQNRSKENTTTRKKENKRRSN